MKRYDLLAIYTSVDEMTILSTDEDVINWITEQIKQACPTVRIGVSDDFTQTKNLCRMCSKMEHRQYYIGLWLIQQLCHKGWEPYGETSFSRNQGLYKITLRREFEVLNS